MLILIAIATSFVAIVFFVCACASIYTLITVTTVPQDETELNNSSDFIAMQGRWEYHTELYWQDVIQGEIGGEKEFRLDDNTRVDILLDEWACEIDWQNKWAEGVGQSIYYGLKTDKKPLVILLVRKDGWEKYRDRVEFCNITCWVFDTRIRTWVDKE